MAKRPAEIQKVPKTKRDVTTLSPATRAEKVKAAIDKAFRVHHDALEELAARDSEPPSQPAKK